MGSLRQWTHHGGQVSTLAHSTQPKHLPSTDGQEGWAEPWASSGFLVGCQGKSLKPSLGQSRPRRASLDLPEQQQQHHRHGSGTPLAAGQRQLQNGHRIFGGNPGRESDDECRAAGGDPRELGGHHSHMAHSTPRRGGRRLSLEEDREAALYYGDVKEASQEGCGIGRVTPFSTYGRTLSRSSSSRASRRLRPHGAGLQCPPQDTEKDGGFWAPAPESPLYVPSRLTRRSSMDCNIRSPELMLNFEKDIASVPARNTSVTGSSASDVAGLHGCSLGAAFTSNGLKSPPGPKDAVRAKERESGHQPFSGSLGENCQGWMVEDCPSANKQEFLGKQHQQTQRTAADFVHARDPWGGGGGPMSMDVDTEGMETSEASDTAEFLRGKPRFPDLDDVPKLCTWTGAHRKQEQAICGGANGQMEPAALMNCSSDEAETSDASNDLEFLGFTPLRGAGALGARGTPAKEMAPAVELRGSPCARGASKWMSTLRQGKGKNLGHHHWKSELPWK